MAENRQIDEADFESTGYSYTLSLISGKYKPIILYCLMEYEPVRFNEMQRYIKKIADKTLSQNLKELEATLNALRSSNGLKPALIQKYESILDSYKIKMQGYTHKDQKPYWN